MTETTTSAAPPKKRTLFKRPAVRAAAKNEEADIFSHSNEFSDIVALEEKQRAEAKKRAEASRDRKRRRISSDNQEAPPPNTGSDKKAQASRASSKARGGTPLSPAPAQSPPASLAARYDSLAKSASSSTLLPTKDSHLISLDDSDDDDDDSGHVSKPLFDESAFDRKPSKADFTQDIAVRPSVAAPVLIEDDDEEPEEDLGPEHAALQARIRARLADRKNRKPSTAPITELLITSDIPDTTPLRVNVRVDTLIEKPRKAWCEKQNFPAKFADDVFFTWNRTRIYDSTSIARLGIKVDGNGNITMEGDSNIYDDNNIPKLHVEAWTDDLFRERKKEDAAAATAKKLAAEPPVEVEQRTPTPEPVATETKLRLVLKAKGMSECKLTVKLTTTVAHLASAFKSRLKIDKGQPITLISQGDRLSPLDTVENCDLEDMDVVEVHLK